MLRFTRFAGFAPVPVGAASTGRSAGANPNHCRSACLSMTILGPRLVTSSTGRLTMEKRRGSPKCDLGREASSSTIIDRALFRYSNCAPIGQRFKRSTQNRKGARPLRGAPFLTRTVSNARLPATQDAIIKRVMALRYDIELSQTRGICGFPHAAFVEARERVSASSSVSVAARSFSISAKCSRLRSSSASRAKVSPSRGR